MTDYNKHINTNWEAVPGKDDWRGFDNDQLDNEESALFEAFGD